MNFIFFIGWVLLIFICADLVGSALQFRLSSIFYRDVEATGAGLGAGERERAAPIEFAHSTLLGFATLWVALSAAYLLGVATQQLIVPFIAASGVAAALAQHKRFATWARSRLMLWVLVGVVALLASFLTPVFNRADDPEYFFLINKLLGSGASVEYFNYRRPLTLGGWTFIQAIFSAGPAGVAFVASIDAVVGSVLFLLCALLLGAGARVALPAALSILLTLKAFQINLGIAIGLGAMCAVLIALSLRASTSHDTFCTIAFAVMGFTIRPQLGVVAGVAVAIVLWRNRSKSTATAGSALAIISTIWILIFLRDTSLLPLSLSPGYNPQVFEVTNDPTSGEESLLWKAKILWTEHVLAFGMTVLAAAICGWQSARSSSEPPVRMDFTILGAFSVAVIGTVAGMVVVLGPLEIVNARYYVPVVQGFLYVFLAMSAVHLFVERRSGSGKWATPALAGVAFVLCVAFTVSKGNISLPTESSMRICKQLLTPEERQAFEQIAHGSGYTLLTFDCPVGSFEMSSSVMMNGLFFATRGDYVDIKWNSERMAGWLETNGVDRLVYLENDATYNFSLSHWRTRVEELKRVPEQLPPSPTRRLGYRYWLENLEKFRELAEHCEGLRMPIRDAQGPLVIIDVRKCQGRSARSPATVNPHQPAAGSM